MSYTYTHSANSAQREVKFFSREVTHVITTRPIPADVDGSSSAHKGTVNPAQLENKKNVFDAALEKSDRCDILYKAKGLGMKIWSVEKLQRMVDTMFNKETGEDASSYPTRQSVAAQKGRPADLQKLLQNEKMDRDYLTASQDMVPLRGYYVYVHDMDEVTRPVMIREYQKVEKEKGKWPQFRASGNGKCPFVEDPHFGRRQQEEQEARRLARQAAQAPRTRAVSALEEKIALAENNNLARRPSAPAVIVKEDEDAKPLDPPKALPLKRCSTADGAPPMFGSAQASIRAMPRFIAGEPVASGLHQSNITSAIRSQMISSTAAAPRAGNSKEVNQLKRKVLEKNSVPSTNTNSGHSSVTNDVRTALHHEHSQPMRAAKRKAQESMGHMLDADEERQARKAAALRRRKTVEKELKPGYCENCREKFNDFDEVWVTPGTFSYTSLTLCSTSSPANTASLRQPARTGLSLTSSSPNLIVDEPTSPCRLYGVMHDPLHDPTNTHDIIFFPSSIHLRPWRMALLFERIPVSTAFSRRGLHPPTWRHGIPCPFPYPVWPRTWIPGC